MKKTLLLISLFACVFAQHARAQQEVATAKMIHNIYRMSTSGSESTPESFKAKTNIPVEANAGDINACLNQITTNLRASLENRPAGAIMNGVDPGRINVINISAPLSGCPSISEIGVKGKWTAVNNHAGQNILTKDAEKIDSENASPIQFDKLSYIVPVDYKEGESAPSKIKGILDLRFPAKLKIAELTSSDVNKEITVGEVRVKLLELKGSTYKLELSNPTLIKVLPLSASRQEFSSNMTRNIPVTFYNTFSKKETLTDEEYAALMKSYDKQDTRAVKLGSVSGTIQKIVVYIPDNFETRQLAVDLEIKN